MIESTVNELAKYAMAGHKKGADILKIEDLITNPKKTFHEDQSVFDAVKVLVNDGSNGFAVVDTQGMLKGFLSEKDCLKHIFEDALNESPSGTVGDYMAKDVTTFNLSTTIYTVMNNFITLPFHTYPVVEDGKYIGEIRRKEVLKKLMQRGFNF